MRYLISGNEYEVDATLYKRACTENNNYQLYIEVEKEKNEIDNSVQES